MSGITTHEVKLKDGSHYIGQLRQRQRHGTGLWVSSDTTYAGQWANDCMHGQGKQTWNGSREYLGQFLGGKFDGYGRMQWTTSEGVTVYEGQYSKDAEDGFGTCTWPDGSRFEGVWRNGEQIADESVQTGYQRERYDDDSEYIGQLCNNLRHGYGKWELHDEKYIGQWHNDVQHGMGLHIWGGNHTYYGQFVHGVREGYGKFIWPDGRIYEGEWADGKRTGNATFQDTKGNLWGGKWGDDVPLTRTKGGG